MMTFKELFPELNENQYKMLTRIIEDEIIGEDAEVPDNSICYWSAHSNEIQNSLRARQLKALKDLMEAV